MSGEADGMENGEEPQRQAAARQACPPPSEVLPPCSAPIWASCLDWESLGSPSNRWKPAPKGVWSWQGQGGAKACLPGTGVSQPLLPQTQESRPPDPPPSDPGVQEPTPRPHRDPSISSPAFPEVSGVDSWFSSQLLLSCLPGLHLFPLLPSSYFSNLCP